MRVSSAVVGLALGLSQLLGGVAATPDKSQGPTNPSFDDSRIRDHPDKLLLSRIEEYFISFTTGDFEGMRDLQAEDFHITDIPLGIVRADREQWYEANKGFSSLMKDVRVDALTLHGSALPGSFAALENVVWFTLAVDPPEEVKPNLPPGIKKGDTSGMIMTSLLWWDEEGLVARDLEYGRLIWDGFEIEAFTNV
ncbi:hypothetical protein FQN54_005435 [Arachnomyces sp. PD_36]|nr:hypothetical protein FQN54_005435 [Arachnomyces sp. PD_36]